MYIPFCFIFFKIGIRGVVVVGRSTERPTVFLMQFLPHPLRRSISPHYKLLLLLLLPFRPQNNHLPFNPLPLRADDIQIAFSESPVLAAYFVFARTHTHTAVGLKSDRHVISPNTCNIILVRVYTLSHTPSEMTHMLESLMFSSRSFCFIDRIFY